MYLMSPCPLLSLVTSEKFVALVLIVVAGQRCRDPGDRRTTTKFYILQIVQIGSKERIQYTFPSLEGLGPFSSNLQLFLKASLNPNFDSSFCNLILDDIHGMCAVAVGGQNNHRDMAGLIYCKYCLNKSPDIHNKCK